LARCCLRFSSIQSIKKKKKERNFIIMKGINVSIKIKIRKEKKIILIKLRGLISKVV